MKTHVQAAKTARVPLNPTQNDLPETNRAKLVELLNSRLAGALDLYLQAKQAHWNVKGRNFVGLHELFDRVADTAREAGDELAERAVQLGGTARGTLQDVSHATPLAAYPPETADPVRHLEALSSAMATFGAQVRSGIELATDLGDADTADLFTEISREADKQLWMVEAHLQGA